MKVEWGRLARTAIATLALLTAAPSLPAQQASTLAASEAEELLGEWALSMDLQGRPVDMTLSLTDVDGHVAASLQGGRRPEPTIISEIAKTDAGLELRWQRDFGGQQATLAMKLALDGDGLTGTFGDDGGFFSAEVSGRRAGTVDAAGAAATAEGAQATADDGDSDGERSRRRSRRYGESVELVLAGHAIHIGYADLDRSSDDYRTLESLENGEVFQYVGGRAIKILTDASLKFGESTIEKGNASSDYPGVYSIWLMKAAGDEWHLVFNEHADVWGIQYLSEADAVHVPVDEGTAEEETDELTVELVELGERAGLLRIAWGSHEWLAPFEVVAE
jgi:hypothetical protein